MVVALFFGSSNFTTAQVNVQDSLALVALYNSTDGPRWKNHTNWLTAQPVKNWSGIILSGDRVRQIFLTDNDLKGSLPSELGNLTNLRNLYLYNNQLSGNIPPELGNLVHLVNLYLNLNQLAGGIPPELGNLINLKNLILFNNHLSGSIPPELGKLTNVVNLYFD